MNPRNRWLAVGIGAAVLLLGWGIAFRGRQPSAFVAPPPPAQGPQRAKEPASDSADLKALLARAEAARSQDSLLEAKQIYRQILQQNPESSAATLVQQKIGEVNLKLILSPAATPESAAYVVQPGDTLSKIARQRHITLNLLKSSNGLTSDVIRPGQRLKIIKPDFSVVVDKSQNILTLKNGEEVLKVYRCSTGKEGITPTGTFKVINRMVDPPWYSTEGVIPPGDPRNVLGTRWLGFDAPGYGIHGTTDPASIGKPVTKGCVRLANSDVEELFTLLPEGTPVTIVD